MVDGAVPKALQLASSKAPKVGGDTCRRTVNKGGLSCLTGKLSHRPSGIFEQLLVLRHPPLRRGQQEWVCGNSQALTHPFEVCGRRRRRSPCVPDGEGPGWSHSQLPWLGLDGLSPEPGVWRPYLLRNICTFLR